MIKNLHNKKFHLPLWSKFAADVALAGALFFVFMLFHHLLPKNLVGEKVIQNNLPETKFELPVETDDKSSDGEPGGHQTDSGLPVGAIQKELEQIVADEKRYDDSPWDRKVTLLKTYDGNNIQFVINKVEIGEGKDKITYYTADFFVTNIKYLNTLVATDNSGTIIKGTVSDLAKQTGALFAVNGDFFSYNSTGLVIRNGVLYRNKPTMNDICVLFLDGTMKIYDKDNFNADEIISKGAWQAWEFGPGLLDESSDPLSSFNVFGGTYHSAIEILKANPRNAIGCVEPGHYMFVMVDGRKEGYSRGVTMTELAQIMHDEGCNTAYNFDGGQSAVMVFDNEVINQPYHNGREVCDIVYLKDSE